MKKTPQSPADEELVESGEERKMGLTDHLGELRSRIIIVAVAFGVFTIGSFIFVDPIVTAMMGRSKGFSFVYLSPAELVTSYVKLAVIMGIVLSSPVILYQIWGFLKPGLHVNEKRAGFGALLGGMVFFVLGAVFAYFVAIPFTLDFFLNFDTTGMISPMISFENYMSYIINTMLAFGAVFEMPVLTLLLSQLGILKPAAMVKFRKYAILLIFIVAAVITPPDVFSQVMVAVPMILLFEISVGVCRVIMKRKEVAEAEWN